MRYGGVSGVASFISTDEQIQDFSKFYRYILEDINHVKTHKEVRGTWTLFFFHILKVLVDSWNLLTE